MYSAHEFTDYQPADPSVGIMYESLVCEDCGEDLTESLVEARRDVAEERAEARSWR